MPRLRWNAGAGRPPRLHSIDKVSSGTHACASCWHLAALADDACGKERLAPGANMLACKGSSTCSRESKSTGCMGRHYCRPQTAAGDRCRFRPHQRRCTWQLPFPPVCGQGYTGSCTHRPEPHGVFAGGAEVPQRDLAVLPARNQPQHAVPRSCWAGRRRPERRRRAAGWAGAAACRGRLVRPAQAAA